jgi:UTP--glucose-1-phosphate uridylyltransferase
VKVRKAVIPVAGLGTRFLPATKAQPKEMLPIVDKPVIQYIVEEAVKAGITQIVFVTGKHKRAIEDHFDRNLELERFLREKGKIEPLEEIKRISEMVQVIYVRQKEPLGLGHAILTAEPAVGDEPFAVLLGDDIIVSEKPAIKQLIEVFERYNCSVIGVEEVDRKEVRKYGIVGGKQVEDGVLKVETLIEKPNPEEAPSNLAISGRYILTPGIFSALKKTKPGKGGEIQLTDALQMLSQKEVIYAKVINGKRFDTGNKLGFLKATVEFALRDEQIKDDFLEFLRGVVGEKNC